jgi:hypothetical protein
VHFRADLDPIGLTNDEPRPQDPRSGGMAHMNIVFTRACVGVDGTFTKRDKLTGMAQANGYVVHDHVSGESTNPVSARPVLCAINFTTTLSNCSGL